MYIDLTQEYVLEQPYDFLGDFQDNPLDGWPTCDTGISEGWNEPFNEEMVGLTTQELNLDDIVENLGDFDDLDDLDDPGESEDLRAYNHYLGNDDDDAQEDDEFYGEYNPEDIFEEQRIDPYDGCWYTKRNFIDYYSGKVEWDHQDPKKILLRHEYHKFCSVYWELNDRQFKFLFKHYSKTWL
jgi:hypothetical protein